MNEIIVSLSKNVGKYMCKKQIGKNNPLLRNLDNLAINKLGEEVLSKVKKHAKVVSASALANGIPGGATVAISAVIASTWKMYYDINKVLGISFSENFLKSTASGIVSNLASNGLAVGATNLMSMIPGVGTVTAMVGGAVINRGAIYTAAITYLKILNSIVEDGGEFTEISFYNYSDISDNETIDNDIDYDYDKNEEERFNAFFNSYVNNEYDSYSIEDLGDMMETEARASSGHIKSCYLCLSAVMKIEFYIKEWFDNLKNNGKERQLELQRICIIKGYNEIQEALKAYPQDEEYNFVWEFICMLKDFWVDGKYNQQYYFNKYRNIEEKYRKAEFNMFNIEWLMNMFTQAYSKILFYTNKISL